MNGANPADGIIRNLPMEKINFQVMAIWILRKERKLMAIAMNYPIQKYIIRHHAETSPHEGACADHE